VSAPPLGRADHLELGTWNAVCYQCGRKNKANTLVKNWQGYWACPEHNEVRQPQDFVRASSDTENPPWTQPMPAPIFVGVCGPNDQSAIAESAVAGCVIAGYVSPSYDPTVTS
jgi:hypothetical protein